MPPAKSGETDTADYMSNDKEDGFFPRIGPRSTKCSVSDSENSDSRTNRTLQASPTLNSGVDNSAVKLPFLERSKLNNAINAENSMPVLQSNTHRSRNRQKRRETLRRSPSLPAQFQLGAEYDRSETDPKFGHTRRSPSVSNDNEVKLPDIFKSQSPVNRVSQSPDPFPQREFPTTWKGNSERTYVIRRTESLQNNFLSTSPEPLLENLHQRSQTQAALLLPLRTSDSRVSIRGKKKKKRLHAKNGTQVNLIERHNSNVHDRSTVNGWAAEDGHGKVNRREQISDDSVNRIRDENESGKRSIEITRSGEVKRWMKEVERAEPGQVKA